jgi:hypothetical protein
VIAVPGLITMKGSVSLPGLPKAILNPTRSLLLRSHALTADGRPIYVGMVLTLSDHAMIEPTPEFRSAEAGFWNEEAVRQYIEPYPNQEWPVWVHEIVGVFRGTVVEGLIQPV